ncbi:MAG: flagellar hook-associated protein FlgK [Candidatus Hydrogenedentes bacterium]|nr:flagellar hook-associated protein FlgK [Candidatus Hydrogenedentota bacterium]
MGTLFSALDIGRSGLHAAQLQLDTAGHNIANVNRTGYSRQRVELAERSPIFTSEGAIGRGVGIETIARIRDTFLDEAYVRQSPALGFAEVRAQYFTLIEDSYLEPTDNGFGTRLTDFFDALNDFANNVESASVREAFLTEASSVASSLNDLISRFDQLRTNANEEVKNLVPEVNSLATQIAALNVQIRDTEGFGQPANDLRDERQVLLDELSRLINITTREDSSGQINVIIGSQILVDTKGAREVIAFRNAGLDPERQDLVELRFADDNSLVEVRDGEIYGAITIRDQVLVEQDAQIDELAAALIYQINRIHSQGNGIENLSGTLSSTNLVSAATDPLVSAGLPFTLTPGTFDVIVYDGAGTPTTTTITITNASTLNSLAADLNAIPNFSASVSGETLSLGTTSPYTFSFANDTSGALAALGVNGLFTGTDARSIAVSQDILDNPNWLTSAYSSDVLNTGDNSAALDMANLRTALVLDSDSSTFDEFYQSIVTGLGVDSRSNTQQLDVTTQFVNDIDRRRQEVSGVNLDEEVAGLIQYQRAFEAAARVITVADRMLETLLNTAA